MIRNSLVDSRITRSTTIKYVLALLLVGVLSVCGNFMLHKVIQRQKSTAAIVNAAGRRRMTSQQIVYYSHMFATVKDEAKSAEVRAKLEAALAKYQKNHLGLLSGDSELGLPGGPSAKMHEYYFGPEANLDGISQEFTSLAYRLLWAGRPTTEAADAIATLGTGKLLERLDKAVGLYQTEAEESSGRLNDIENILLLCTILVLGGEALFVFRPLTTSISRLISRLEDGRTAVKRLLDNSGQGFLLVDARGIVADEYSKTAEELFGLVPAGKHLAEVFHQTEERWSAYVTVLFNESVAFKSLVDVCPGSIEVDGRVLDLGYRQVRDAAGMLSHILIIATDVTALKAVERKAEQERSTNKSLLTILGTKNQFIDLLELVPQLRDPSLTQAKVMGLLHTAKGGFAFFECRDISRLCHEWEGRLKETFTAALVADAEASLSSHIEEFLSRHENILGLGAKRKKVVKVEVSQIDFVVRKAARLRVPNDLLTSIQKLKEVPIDEALNWLGNATRSLARDLKKEVSPIAWTSSVSISPDDYRDLFLSLIHIVRNSIDHGLEPVDKRREAGKPRRGQISIALEERGEFYRLVFKDDGRGVDINAVRAKASSLGINTVGKSEDEILDLLFHPNFSTKEIASEISGRGVGLNAVRDEARKLEGDAKAINSPGKGLEIEIEFRRKQAMLSAAA